MDRNQAEKTIKGVYPEFRIDMAVKFKDKWIFTPKREDMRRVPPLSVDENGRIATFTPLDPEYEEYAEMLQSKLSKAKKTKASE